MAGVVKTHDVAEDGLYTEDGTIDIHKRPANKKKTGNWKACRFILGIGFSFSLSLSYKLTIPSLKHISVLESDDPKMLK